MSVGGIVLLIGVEGPSPWADTIPWAGGPDLYKRKCSQNGKQAARVRSFPSAPDCIRDVAAV